VREVIRQIDPTLPIGNLRTLEQAIAAIDTQNLVLLKILTGLALAALVLAAVGIYGTIAYSVNQRTREIGIRSALGARPGHAVGLVARQAVLLTLVGLAVGCGLAWMFVRFMASELEGIVQTNAGSPLTFLVVVVFFVLVAALASVVPAARAVRLDPVQALRED
jgi:putative ABC transport system permease protein